jgi:aldose 1-epimerase
MNQIKETKIKTNINTEETIVEMINNLMRVKILTYGASIFEFIIDGKRVDVAPSNINDFMSDKIYYGKTLGRTSGRIFLPGYQINNKFYKIKDNHQGIAKIHGGVNGFSFKTFKIEEAYADNDKVIVKLSYKSPANEEEYPGNLNVLITYTLTGNNFKITYDAISDEDTLCNLTNHIYFNLSAKEMTIDDHSLKVASDKFIEVDERVIFKNIKKVDNTVYDLRDGRSFKDIFKKLDNHPLKGFDNPFLLSKKVDCVELVSASSNYKLVCSTTYPAVVIYTHNQPFRSPNNRIKFDGVHSCVALEFQFEPGGIHIPSLNSAILHKNEKYHHEINFSFIKI